MLPPPRCRVSWPSYSKVSAGDCGFAEFAIGRSELSACEPARTNRYSGPARRSAVARDRANAARRPLSSDVRYHVGGEVSEVVQVSVRSDTCFLADGERT